MISITRRSVFLVLLALWLPLQSALAFAMPFCGHVRQTVGSVPMASHGHGGHAAHASQAHHHDPGAETALAGDSVLPDTLGGCDQCGLCHLACAGFMPPSPQTSGPLAPTHVLVSAALSAVTSPDLDRLDRPPLAAA